MSDSDAVRVTAREKSPVLRELEVEVASTRVKRAYDRGYRNLARSVRVKGFRPGKAPRSVLERLYGASLAEEIARELVAESLPEALDRSALEPVAEPAVDPRPPAPDQPFRYVATVEVKPAITLPSLEGLPARQPPVIVSDEEVEGELAALRERRAPVVDAPEGARAAPGSILTLDYQGRIDGEPFEGGSLEGATVELGSGRLLPGFEEQLEGAVPGEEREVRITFPADYPAEDVAGREALFQVRVQAVRQRELPDLDDAFARELGGDFETLDALRERIRSDLLESRERGAKQQARRSLMDALIERTAFEVPPGLVDRRLQQRLSLAHDQLARSLPHEELHARLAEWRESWRPEAERDVREALLLEAVAEQQEIEVTPEQVEARVEQQAREQGLAPERLRKRYEERGLLATLAAQMREEGALEFLLAKAKVEETTGT